MAGKLVPHVALYSKRYIDKGEELAFMYGKPNPGPGTAIPGDSNLSISGTPVENRRSPARQCLCKTGQCLGYLPNEAV